MERSRQWALAVSNEINSKREILKMIPEKQRNYFNLLHLVNVGIVLLPLNVIESLAVINL